MILYHGPMSRSVALNEAMTQGRFIASVGDEGLTVEASRELVELLGTNPVGDDIGTILVGPLDDASSEASNALLKTLEEGSGKYIQAYLWALDMGSVISTIRSRCLEQWCPSESGLSAEYPFVGKATIICEAALRQRVAALIEGLAEHRGNELNVLRASVEVLQRKSEWPLKARLRLWKNLRELLMDSSNPSPVSMLTAYLL